MYGMPTGLGSKVVGGIDKGQSTRRREVAQRMLLCRSSGGGSESGMRI